MSSWFIVETRQTTVTRGAVIGACCRVVMILFVINDPFLNVSESLQTICSHRVLVFVIKIIWVRPCRVIADDWKPSQASYSVRRTARDTWPMAWSDPDRFGPKKSTADQIARIESLARFELNIPSDLLRRIRFLDRNDRFDPKKNYTAEQIARIVSSAMFSSKRHIGHE